jgi:hypothetical protein
MSERVAIQVEKQSRQPFYASNYRTNHFVRQMRGLAVALVIACFVFFNWEFYKTYVFKERSSAAAPPA